MNVSECSHRWPRDSFRPNLKLGARRRCRCCGLEQAKRERVEDGVRFVRYWRPM